MKDLRDNRQSMELSLLDINFFSIFHSKTNKSGSCIFIHPCSHPLKNLIIYPLCRYPFNIGTKHQRPGCYHYHIIKPLRKIRIDEETIDVIVVHNRQDQEHNDTYRKEREPDLPWELKKHPHMVG